jgi:uncharacterized membrane protein YgdD (TMEM256/DUF423 family)
MDRVFVTAGALSAFVAVAAGAFGAHALRDRLTADQLGVWQTAAAYEMYHALALLSWLGAITPLGGLAFLLGWAALAVGIWRR